MHLALLEATQIIDKPSALLRAAYKQQMPLPKGPEKLLCKAVAFLTMYMVIAGPGCN